MPSTAFAADGYLLTDLGVLPGGGFSFGFGINAAGDVCGSSDAADAAGFGMRAMLVAGGGMMNIGLPDVPFAIFSEAPALNDKGEVLVSGNNGAGHAFVWQDGAYTDITTLPGALYSDGHRINNGGQVVGNIVIQLPGGNFPHHAFLYDGAQMIDLNPLFGGDYSDAVGINQGGTIVGEARFAGSPTIHGFMLQDGVVTNLGPSSTITSEASAINDNGQIVGGAYFDGLHEHPMSYFAGQTTDLGLLPGAIGGNAAAINDAGVIVGFCTMPSSNVKRAFVYSDGQMRALTDLLPAGSTWKVEKANDINAAGTIVGTARNSQGLRHAVVLTPITVCIGDLSGDGVVNGADLGLLLGTWGPCSGCAADLNDDGVVDGADLGTLLGTWGTCP